MAGSLSLRADCPDLRGFLMGFESHFEPVLPGVMIDDRMKLRAILGHWTPESSARGGTQTIELYYDPEIERGRLTMPIPEKRLERLKLLGPVEKDWTYFESARSVKLAGIICNIEDVSNRIEIIVQDSPESFRYHSSLIEKAYGESDRKTSWEIFLYFIRSLIGFPSWDRDYPSNWGVRAVSVCIREDVAREFSKHVGAFGVPAENGLVEVAVRELAA